MKNEFYIWLAGFIDGDGCFCVYPQYRERAGYLTVAFSVSIGLTKSSQFLLERIAEKTEIGKVYTRGTTACVWQTVSIEEAIELTKRVLPHLRLKKKIAEQFLVAAKQYQIKPVRGKRPRGTKLRGNKEMKSYIDIALSLNNTQQTKRYRNRKGKDYWYSVVDKLYPVLQQVEA